MNRIERNFYYPIYAYGLALVMAICLMTGPSQVQAQTAEDYQHIITTNSDAIVTVNLITKTSFGFGGQSDDMENRTTETGLLIDDSGLVMLPNHTFDSSMVNEIFGGGVEYEILVEDIKILFGNDPKEFDAFMVATDSKLGFAFVKVKDLEKKKVKSVSFEDTPKVTLGQEVIVLSRLDEIYDYAPWMQITRIGGEVKKPKNMWVTTDNLPTMGSPVFNQTGQLLGIVAIPEIVSMFGEDWQKKMRNPVNMMVGMGNMIRPFVVPGKEFLKVIKRVKKKAVELEKKQKK